MPNSLLPNSFENAATQVLLIDDCPDIHPLVEKFLSPTGIRLSHAYGGEEGFRIASATLPALILLDYSMPDCNGIQVLSRLVCDSRLKDIPVIMITGDSNQTLIASAYEHGVCDYINKPLRPVELRARVRSALKMQALINDLRHRAEFDSLTGLSNKSSLLERIQSSIDLSRNGLDAFAVLFIDFDRFKLINDSLGHTFGDQVLQEAAIRLRTSIRQCDLVVRRNDHSTVSRFGGDEFVILLNSLRNINDAAQVALRLLSVMREPFKIDGRTIYIGSSIGIVTCSGQYHSPDDVIRDADIAMYEAKEAGRDCFRVFDTTMRSRALQRWQIDTDLRQAITLNQFRLQYQPIVNLKTGLVESVEALIRWDHPKRGLISPLDFIPVAEETGLIVEIGDWVIRTACKQFAQWRLLDLNSAPSHISINLSRQQLVHPDFFESIQEIFEESGVEPARVHFEITESEMMHDLPASIRAINQIRGIGTKIDLDDFGTGYSSLSCLHQLPIDVLKLDRSLVANIDSTVYFSRLAELVLQLLSGTQIQVVAEGIETIDQLTILQGLNCQLGQGFYFSKPINGDKVQAFVCNQRPQLHSDSFSDVHAQLIQVSRSTSIQTCDLNAVSSMHNSTCR